MKRNICKLLLAALTVPAAMAACTDQRDNDMVDDAILFRDEAYLGISLLDKKKEFAVIKSGKSTSGATVRLFVSEVALAEYNALNDTAYELLPEEFYDISATTLDFAENDIRKVVNVSWNDADLIALGDATSYAVPIQLAVVNNALAVNEEMNTVLICPLWSYVSMEVSETPEISPNILGYTATYDAYVVMENEVRTKDITVNLAIDNSLVDSYNEANGTSYAVAPDGFIALHENSTVIKAGTTTNTFTYDVVSSVFFTDGVFDGFDENGYVIPIRITSVSSEGVKIRDNDVMYIPVTLEAKEIKGPWTVLEGADLCYANQPGGRPGWAGVYTVDRLFDGDVNTEWISWWFASGESAQEQNIQFPMSFVADMGNVHLFTEFRIADYKPHHGNYRKYEIYLAEEYNYENPSATEWSLAANGTCEYDGTARVYNYPPANGTLNMVPGRYIKFVIVEPQLPMSGDVIWGRGKLSEVYGIGY